MQDIQPVHLRVWSKGDKFFFNCTSTIVGYLMPNPLYIYIYIYIYIKDIYFGFIGFCGISTIVGYSMPNPHIYIYICIYIYALVWLGFRAYEPL